MRPRLNEKEMQFIGEALRQYSVFLKEKIKESEVKNRLIETLRKEWVRTQDVEVFRKFEAAKQNAVSPTVIVKLDRYSEFADIIAKRFEVLSQGKRVRTLDQSLFLLNDFEPEQVEKCKK